MLGRQTECEALPIERLLFDEKDSRLAQDLVDMEKAGHDFKSMLCSVHLAGAVISETARAARVAGLIGLEQRRSQLLGDMYE